MLQRHAARLLTRIGVAIDDHRAGPGGTRLQVAALPYRSGEHGVEILLVTSRRSRRWILPKGWPLHGQSLADSAAREAYEEAGIQGETAPGEIGRFMTMKPGAGPHPVLVFPLAVVTELAHWPEQRERSRKWFPIGEAIAAIAPDQRELLRGFEP
ncbi:MAG: NUDIX hydrolase [Sphingomonadaceae bacterium]|nr:NUDIX hydrolase [Sphingomonadaceae bacterium]